MNSPKVGKDGRYEVIRRLGPGEERRLSPTTRRLVIRRDRCKCVWCGKGGRLEVDHIIPWSAGGSDDMDNLRTLCQSCNQGRSNYASAGDTTPPRFPTGHECVYCTPVLLGEPDIVNVYCIHCNKLAPGLPVNPHLQAPEPRPAFSDEELYGRENEELDEVAAKYRDDAVATIRQALTQETPNA